MHIYKVTAALLIAFAFLSGCGEESQPKKDSFQKERKIGDERKF